MLNGRPIAKFVRINCDCLDGEGVHLIDLYNSTWNDPSMGFYTCNTCNRPLVCRGDDGQIYVVGARLGFL
jgi:hypothetical protein